MIQKQNDASSKREPWQDEIAAHVETINAIVELRAENARLSHENARLLQILDTHGTFEKIFSDDDVEVINYRPRGSKPSDPNHMETVLPPVLAWPVIAVTYPVSFVWNLFRGKKQAERRP
jgi:hypothetical protein